MAAILRLSRRRRRIVVAPRTAGVPNWLDKAGYPRAVFRGRWTGCNMQPIRRSGESSNGTEVAPAALQACHSVFVPEQRVQRLCARCDRPMSLRTVIGSTATAVINGSSRELAGKPMCLNYDISTKLNVGSHIRTRRGSLTTCGSTRLVGSTERDVSPRAFK